MKKLIIIATLLLTGCEEVPPTGYVCLSRKFTCSQKYWVKYVCDADKQAKFILGCNKTANPMSDEEGEDLVHECHKVSKQLYCTRSKYK